MKLPLFVAACSAMLILAFWCKFHHRPLSAANTPDKVIEWNAETNRWDTLRRDQFPMGDLYGSNSWGYGTEFKTVINDSIRPDPSPLPDTTVKPAYQYFYTVDPTHLNNLLYVTDSLILNDFGVELSGTVIKNSKKFYIDYKEALLRSGIRKDSVKIKP